MNRIPTTALLLSLLAGATPALAVANEGYYRDPDVHGDKVVFAAEGDLWQVGIAGGVARRLTTHPGAETHPAISPDGLSVAFTASYEGSAEVYTMPLSGGLPTRWTWEAEPSTVVGWRDNGNLVYSTEHFSTLPDPQLVQIDLTTGERQLIPLTPAEDAAFSGTQLVFTRPGFHRNNTKRYQGGTARDLWFFDETTSTEAVNLTQDFEGEDHSPEIHADRVYYVTDRDGTMNVWSMPIAGGQPLQHTFHAGWDVRSLSVDDNRIIYRVGADLWRLELVSGDTQRLGITLPSDFDQLREKWESEPMQYLTSAALSPDGSQIALAARGRLFVAPARDGRLVQVSRAEGVRYREASFTNDGQSLIALSDESGEVELWRLSSRGLGERQQLTSDGEIVRFNPLPSPDGSRVAYTDRNNDLWVLDTGSGRQLQVNLGREGAFHPSWSPDGRWLAYAETATNTYAQIHLVNIVDGQRTILTSDRVNSYYPAWDPNGDWLFFVSDRVLRSSVPGPWGPLQPEPFFDNTRKIYQVGLRPGLRPTFRPADELLKATQSATDKSKNEEKEIVDSEERPPAPIQVILEGIQQRFWELPVKAGNYQSLRVGKDALYWHHVSSPVDRDFELQALKLERDSEVVTITSGITLWDLSTKGDHLLVRKGKDLYVFDAKPQKVDDLSKSKVDLSAWRFSLDVREDFRQLFIDAWRLERDFFYDPGMHGLDWDAVREKYEPLVDRVTTRDELSDLIGEVVGELSALHVSVRGGDHRSGEDQIRLPTLGARLDRDPDAGGYRIARIYRGEADFVDERSPLSDPYLEISEGDVITAINGVDLLSVADPGVLLRDQASRQVLLSLSTGAAAPREVIVTPMTGEADLRYSDWEVSRRLRAEERSAGRVGYLHLRAMSGANLTEWYRGFYPVFDRQGLVIDVRHNRGGNIDSIILEKLLRRAWFYWQSRAGAPTWNMQYAFRGHLVVLVDEDTASDGEAFAEGFRRLGLGKVIGVRTWGGEIWLSNNNLLSDGGLARAPQTGVYSAEGEWLIEGWGVEPDIEVENLPHATFLGEDSQLDAAIDLLLEEIEKDPRPVPDPPDFPDKSFDPSR